MLGFCLVVMGVAAKAANVDPTSYFHKTEPHHALNSPMEKAQVYWNFGGSTVMTRNMMRLTQDTQDRKGWLWNDYPLESEHWEIAFTLEIFSKPNYGGDGMCMWVLSSDHDPSFADDDKGLSGPVMGLMEDFEGMGVCFDVYDNDQRRNNPSVFSMYQSKDNKKTFNHDNDYEDDMIKETPPQFLNTALLGSKEKVAHKCVADVRNAGKPHKVLVKYLHGMLHVYIDSQTGQGYKFCFLVEVKQSLLDYHIAFTAATGQVADAHDVHEVTVRYLDVEDEDPDDLNMDSYSTSRTRSWGDTFFNLIAFATFGLMSYAANQAMVFKKLTTARIDIVRVCKSLNATIAYAFIAQAVLAFLCLCTFNWLLLIFHIPMAIFRFYLFLNGEMHMREGAVTGDGEKGHGSSGVPAKIRIGANLGHGLLCTIYCLYRWFS